MTKTEPTDTPTRTNTHMAQTQDRSKDLVSFQSRWVGWVRGMGWAWWVGGAGERQSVITNKPGDSEPGQVTHTYTHAHRPYAGITFQLWHSC